MTFRNRSGVPTVSLSAAESCLSDVSAVLVRFVSICRLKQHLRQIVSFFYASDQITEALLFIFISHTPDQNHVKKEESGL